MASITYYAAIPFVQNEDGELFAGEAKEAPNEHLAKRHASSMAAANYIGAVAFSRTGDPSTGDFEPAVILARYGNIPADISEYTGA